MLSCWKVTVLLSRKCYLNGSRGSSQNWSKLLSKRVFSEIAATPKRCYIHIDGGYCFPENR
jgi:hypothetical protein